MIASPAFGNLALQAVTYFRRALKLNYQYLSAWTLMGHEYVEMKSPPAAIGASLNLHSTPEFHAFAVAWPRSWLLSTGTLIGQEVNSQQDQHT